MEIYNYSNLGDRYLLDYLINNRTLKDDDIIPIAVTLRKMNH